MKLYNSAWLAPFLEKLRGAPEWTQEPVITRLQGSIHAKVILLAPIPTEVEYQRNVAWCDRRYDLFFQYLSQAANLRPAQFLVAPCIFYGAKVRTQELALSKLFLNHVAAAAHVSLVVCIGLTPFKAYFSRTKAPSANTLCGRVMRGLVELPNKAVLVTPNLEPWLAHGKQPEEFTSRAEFHKAVREFNELNKRLQSLRLAQTLAEYV